MLGTDRVKGEQTGNRSPEGQLLLTVVTQKLRERCGFIPGYDHRPIQPAVKSDRLPLISERAMRDFQLMYAGIYRDLLPEWLMTVIEAKRRVWDEFLPHLLMLGQKQERFRQYIVPVLGEAGFWLASEITNQNWKWAFEIPEMDIDYLRYGEQNREREFIKQLNEKPFSSTHIPELQEYRQVWTESLMRAFLNSVEKARWDQAWIKVQMQPVTKFSLFYPLGLRSEILSRLNKLDESIACAVQIMLDFRETMINAITEGDNA